MKSRRALPLIAVFAAAVAACSTTSSHGATGGTSSSSASQGATGSSASTGRGVTASEIRVGITFPDLTQLQKTLNVNGGSYPDAFNAVIDDINAHGGVNGRKLVPFIAPVNVVGTAGAAQACTKLTEDDRVFVVVGFFQAPDTLCYLKTHQTPLVGASLTAAQQVPGEAPWFNSLLADDHLVPKELQVFKQSGLFAGHKVAVVGEAADQSQMQTVVLPELRTLGVDVVQTAKEDAPSGDVQALDSQYQLISQKFQSAGADVVVAVGDSGANWPHALADNHSTYTPQLIATNENTLAGYTQNSNGYDPKTVKNAVSAISVPPPSIWWTDPALQRCVGIIKSAFPQDGINDPTTATSKTPQTWSAPESTCSTMALVVDILKAAGSTLDNQTFLTGGESLTNVTLPGSGGSLHFGAGHHDGNGPMFLYRWNDATNKFDVTTSNS
jgi:ABC-type branched-subunit amino acid transport system substrate-binding protein